eukprot:5740021-Pyramimonas_sp.AAC.3
MWRRFSKLSLRQKVILGGAAGAVGAGVYYAGSKLYEMYSETSREVEEYREEKQAHKESTRKQEAEIKLHHHAFDSATPGGEPIRACESDGAHRQTYDRKVRRKQHIVPKGQVCDMERAEDPKYALALFCLILRIADCSHCFGLPDRTYNAAAVGISLLEVFVRVQLNIIGRICVSTCDEANVQATQHIAFNSFAALTINLWTSCTQDLPSTLSKTCQVRKHALVGDP